MWSLWQQLGAHPPLPAPKAEMSRLTTQLLITPRQCKHSSGALGSNTHSSTFTRTDTRSVVFLHRCELCLKNIRASWKRFLVLMRKKTTVPYSSICPITRGLQAQRWGADGSYCSGQHVGVSQSLPQIV